MSLPGIMGLSLARPTSWLVAQGIRPSVYLRDPAASSLEGLAVAIHTSIGPGRQEDHSALERLCAEAGITAPERGALALEKGLILGLARVVKVLPQVDGGWVLALAEAAPLERPFPGPALGEWMQVWPVEQVLHRVLRREADLLGWGRPRGRAA